MKGEGRNLSLPLCETSTSCGACGGELALVSENDQFIFEKNISE